jgi:predicted nucleic acid-binding OB-fold protein
VSAHRVPLRPGLRQTAVDRIVSERQKDPFEGIDDLV